MKTLFLSALLTLICISSQAQNYKLYTIFINSFARYIQWPEESNKGDFEIFVLGESPIIAELKTLADLKKVGNRSIHITKINSVSEIKKCNILFIPVDKSGLMKDALAKLGQAPTLIVTEQEGLGIKGSGINFVEKAGKPAFELNNASLNSRGLRASTELTRMAIMI